MGSFVMVIRSVYFGAKNRRKYAKSVGVNRSGFGPIRWVVSAYFSQLSGLLLKVI